VEIVSAQAIQKWLLTRLSALIGAAPAVIDIREPFASYGLGSTEAVSLSGELADWLGRPLSPDLAYEFPTIESLARHLGGSVEILEAAIEGGPVREASDEPIARAQAASARDPGDEPIAIIGLGCRFPGAKDAHAFRQLLRDGTDAITEVPRDRFDLDAFYDPDPQAPGKLNTRWGGFLEQVDQFDPHFFGISPREAARMDPQQRLLLEVALEALEDAGQLRERLAGTATGVFIGISNNDYGRMQFRDPALIDAYAGTGNALSIAANRLSYLNDFRGPSIAIDTACSSSLVAVHLACRSLWTGESTLALAGGVNLILSPAISINFSKAGVMAPDGRCKTFDSRANGYVRSEGAGLVVLKPLAQAIADADPIYAVIRGSAINQDGRSNGLMAPNPLAQEAVLREAYRRADVSPGRVQYVEAHGTGTFLGDPIEAKALGAVLAIDRPPERPCAIGSVKTNIGHLEAAAGIAGLIKVALALKHRELPPSLHFHEANPNIPFATLPLRVQTEFGPWPAQAGDAIAGVSSFGFGGTNAHVVLAEAPQVDSVRSDADRGMEYPPANFDAPRSSYVLPLSARSADALRSAASAYRDLIINAGPAASMRDICYTASVRRTHREHRLALVGASAAQLADGLEAFLQSEAHPGLSSAHSVSSRQRKLVFVFPGQGSQWFGMGQTLLHQEPVFREVIERCDRAMRACGDWSLLAELNATDPSQSRLGEIDLLQPALFAIQVALAALWRSRGIESDAVVGHSMGECAAACVAGVLSLEDAARVICQRSRLIKPTIGHGAMAAVELPLEDARRALKGYEDRVSIGVSNSPTSTVLSGDREALNQILDRLQRQDVLSSLIKVDFAAHSPQMDPLRDNLSQALAGMEPRPAALPIYSTVTGGLLEGMEFGPRHWARNLREPVLFSAAVQRLLEDGYDTFIEVSPHPILLSAIQQGINHRGSEGAVLPSMRRDEDERAVMLGSLGALYTLGYPIDWRRLYPQAGQCVSLPSYSWQRERCWMEPEDPHRDAPVPRLESGSHPLLGRHFKSAQPGCTHFWEATLDRTVAPWLHDHRIQGVALLPASAYIEMAMAAATAAFDSTAASDSPAPVLRDMVLRDIDFHAALFFPEAGPRAVHTVQVILAPGAYGEASFDIYSRPAGVAQSSKSWTRHASGKVSAQPDSSVVPNDVPIIQRKLAGEIQALQARCSERLSGPDYYAKLEASGIHYGPAFQSVRKLWRSNGRVSSEVLGQVPSEVHGQALSEVVGDVKVPATPNAGIEAYRFHPAIVDACLQTLAAALATESAEAAPSQLYVPTHIDELRMLRQRGARLCSHAQLRERTADSASGEVRLMDDAGQVAVEIRGLRFVRLDGDAPRPIADNPHDSVDSNDPRDPDNWLYELQWQLKGRVEEPTAAPNGINPGIYPKINPSPGSWLIFADNGGVGTALAARMQAAGESSVLVTRGASFNRIDDNHFRLDPAVSEDYRQLFVAALATPPRCRGIIHLWSLDTDFTETSAADSLQTAQSLGCGSVLPLVQELALSRCPDPPRLWMVTQGAQAAGEASLPLNVVQAPLWGLGRVIAQEHPMLWGGLIDLDPHAALAPSNQRPEVAADQLWQQISAPDGEDQLAYRQGRRYVARLTRHHPVPATGSPRKFRPDGSYLIAGGLGDLGLAVACWMVERGARRLVLLGRSKLPPRSTWSAVAAEHALTAEPSVVGTRAIAQIAAIRELEALGASVHLGSVDVANESELRAFLDEFRAEGWPPIRGVVHAAGVLRDGLLADLDAAAMDSVMRPKVMGGWLLHQLLHDAPLDFSVLFSSAGSLLGQAGQGNYAAANAFLDALAHHRRAQGQPALTINWGAWADLGFADTPGGKHLAARLALAGIKSIPPKQALAVMERQLRADSTQVVVVPLDWRQYRKFYPAGTESPLLFELAQNEANQLALSEADLALPTGHQGDKKVLDHEALLAVQPAERHLLLLSYLTEQVARVLGLSSVKLDVHQPLSNLGLDSLMAVELKNRIAVDLGLNVPMVKFLQGPSVEQAATILVDQLATGASAALPALSLAVPQREEAPENDRSGGHQLAEVDQLSDDEVNSLLTDLLAKEEARE
jgi:acyl transferase domain-containing protein/acyl carrier protein